jgi:hypothetical protein
MLVHHLVAVAHRHVQRLHDRFMCRIEELGDLGLAATLNHIKSK